MAPSTVLRLPADEELQAGKGNAKKSRGRNRRGPAEIGTMRKRRLVF